MITASPQLTDLLSFIKIVPEYPILAKDVARLAEDKGADNEVVDFYRAFPDRAVFSDQEDLVVRTESLEVLNRDDQPPEIYLVPEED